jgi:hypothetical protein
MAEDENAKVGGETVPSSVAPVSAFGPVSGTAAEWTASDARGPLSAAGERTMPEASTSEPGLSQHPAIEHPVSEPSTIESPVPSAHPALADDAVFADASHVSEPLGSPPEPTPPGVAPSSAAVAPRRSLWPVAGGIVLGAIIGAGSAAAYYAYLTPQGGDPAQVAALSSRVDALQNRPDAAGDIASLKASVADLGTKVDALQKGAAARADTPQANADSAKPAFDPAPLEQKLAAVQGEVDALKQQGADAKALDGKVAALAASVAALNGVDGKVSALQSSVDGLQKQSTTTQSSLDTLQSNQKALEGKVTSSPALAVVADSLVAQIASGEPYANQVEALASLGADPAAVAVLKENADKGVPSAKALAAQFEPLADPILATERHAAPNASFWDRLKSGMSGLVSIRSADDTTGDTLASHVALIQADLAHDDVAGAYKVWSALPAAAKAKSDAWGALAKTHAEAMRAARTLQAQAITALGAKKS